MFSHGCMSKRYSRPYGAEKTSSSVAPGTEYHSNPTTQNATKHKPASNVSSGDLSAPLSREAAWR